MHFLCAPAMSLILIAVVTLEIADGGHLIWIFRLICRPTSVDAGRRYNNHCAHLYEITKGAKKENYAYYKMKASG